MAGAEGGLVFFEEVGEAHFQQTGYICFTASVGFLLRGRAFGAAGCWGGDILEEEFTEVWLVHRDAVDGGVVFSRVIRLRAQLLADGYAGCEADDIHADGIGHELGDGAVNIARVGGVEGPVDDDDLAGAMGGGVEEGAAGHGEGVLEGGIAFGFLDAEVVQGGDVFGGVTGEGGDWEGDAIAHANEGELGDRVLLEEGGDEGGDVADCQEVSGWSEVLFCHGGGEIDDDGYVPDDASLKWSRVAKDSKGSC